MAKLFVTFCVVQCIQSSLAFRTTKLIKEKPPSDVNWSVTDKDKISANTLQYRNNLPECAAQQVCSALFVRMNYSQPLCQCSENFNWECNSETTVDDGHTVELTRRYDKKVYTQVKLCEPLMSVRNCKTPTDWTLLALQSERSGKAHYVMVCRCPDSAQFEGPYTHNHPPYARVPGIRVYGMLCNQASQKKARLFSATKIVTKEDSKQYPEFPWDLAYAVLNSTSIQGLW